jgi:hypothetical protein
MKVPELVCGVLVPLPLHQPLTMFETRVIKPGCGVVVAGAVVEPSELA